MSSAGGTRHSSRCDSAASDVVHRRAETRQPARRYRAPVRDGGHARWRCGAGRMAVEMSKGRGAARRRWTSSGVNSSPSGASAGDCASRPPECRVVDLVIARRLVDERRLIVVGGVELDRHGARHRSAGTRAGRRSVRSAVSVASLSSRRARTSYEDDAQRREQQTPKTIVEIAASRARSVSVMPACR